MSISLHDVVAASARQASCNVGAEVVILHLDRGFYYGLNNEVGQAVWSRLAKPCAVADVVAAVLELFEVERETCERDVLQLLEDLAARGLIEVNHAAAP